VTAADAGDVVARELVALLRSVVLSDDAYTDAGHLGPGWKVIAQSLAALVVDRPGNLPGEMAG